MKLTDLMDEVSETKDDLCDRSIVLRRYVQIYSDTHRVGEPEETISLADFKRKLDCLPCGKRDRQIQRCAPQPEPKHELLKVEDIDFDTGNIIEVKCVDSVTGEVVHQIRPMAK
jgi:hypothetical protein